MTSFVSRFFYQILKYLGQLPQWPRVALAHLVAFGRWHFNKRDRFYLLENINRILKLPTHTKAAQRFAKQVLWHEGIIALETFTAIFFPKKVVVTGQEEVKALINQLEQQPGGQMIITAHLGSWEMVGTWTIAFAHKPFYAFAKKARSPIFTDLLTRLRNKQGIRVLFADNKSVGRDLVKLFKEENAWLTFVMDQKPQGRRGAEVQFLERPTPFVTGPAAMASRYQCPVLAFFVVRTGYLKFHLHAKIILQRNHGHSDEKELTQMFADEISTMIKLYPEQWVWEYKRWTND